MSNWRAVYSLYLVAFFLTLTNADLVKDSVEVTDQFHEYDDYELPTVNTNVIRKEDSLQIDPNDNVPYDVINNPNDESIANEESETATKLRLMLLVTREDISDDAAAALTSVKHSTIRPMFKRKKSRFKRQFRVSNPSTKAVEIENVGEEKIGPNQDVQPNLASHQRTYGDAESIADVENTDAYVNEKSKIEFTKNEVFSNDKTTITLTDSTSDSFHNARSLIRDSHHENDLDSDSSNDISVFLETSTEIEKLLKSQRNFVVVSTPNSAPSYPDLRPDKKHLNSKHVTKLFTTPNRETHHLKSSFSDKKDIRMKESLEVDDYRNIPSDVTNNLTTDDVYIASEENETTAKLRPPLLATREDASDNDATIMSLKSVTIKPKSKRRVSHLKRLFNRRASLLKKQFHGGNPTTIAIEIEDIVKGKIHSNQGVHQKVRNDRITVDDVEFITNADNTIDAYVNDKSDMEFTNTDSSSGDTTVRLRYPIEAVSIGSAEGQTTGKMQPLLIATRKDISDDEATMILSKHEELKPTFKDRPSRLRRPKFKGRVSRLKRHFLGSSPSTKAIEMEDIGKDEIYPNQDVHPNAANDQIKDNMENMIAAYVTKKSMTEFRKNDASGDDTTTVQLRHSTTASFHEDRSPMFDNPMKHLDSKLTDDISRFPKMSTKVQRFLKSQRNSVKVSTPNSAPNHPDPVEILSTDKKHLRSNTVTTVHNREPYHSKTPFDRKSSLPNDNREKKDIREKGSVEKVHDRNNPTDVTNNLTNGVVSIAREETETTAEVRPLSHVIKEDISDDDATVISLKHTTTKPKSKRRASRLKRQFHGGNPSTEAIEIEDVGTEEIHPNVAVHQNYRITDDDVESVTSTITYVTERSTAQFTKNDVSDDDITTMRLRHLTTASFHEARSTGDDNPVKRLDSELTNDISIFPEISTKVHKSLTTQTNSVVASTPYSAPKYPDLIDILLRNEKHSRSNNVTTVHTIFKDEPRRFRKQFEVSSLTTDSSEKTDIRKEESLENDHTHSSDVTINITNEALSIASDGNETATKMQLLLRFTGKDISDDDASTTSYATTNPIFEHRTSRLKRQFGDDNPSTKAILMKPGKEELSSNQDVLSDVTNDQTTDDAIESITNIENTSTDYVDEKSTAEFTSTATVRSRYSTTDSFHNASLSTEDNNTMEHLDSELSKDISILPVTSIIAQTMAPKTDENEFSTMTLRTFVLHHPYITSLVILFNCLLLLTVIILCVKVRCMPNERRSTLPLTDKSNDSQSRNAHPLSNQSNDALPLTNQSNDIEPSEVCPTPNADGLPRRPNLSGKSTSEIIKYFKLSENRNLRIVLDHSHDSQGSAEQSTPHNNINATTGYEEAPDEALDQVHHPQLSPRSSYDSQCSSEQSTPHSNLNVTSYEGSDEEEQWLKKKNEELNKKDKELESLVRTRLQLSVSPNTSVSSRGKQQPSILTNRFLQTKNDHR